MARRVAVAAALPAATGIAILRYRLYETDVIIRKTLVYTVLAESLVIVYLGRLRSQVDLEALHTDVLPVVRSTVKPAHATLWIRR